MAGVKRVMHSLPAAVAVEGGRGEDAAAVAAVADGGRGKVLAAAAATLHHRANQCPSLNARSMKSRQNENLGYRWKRPEPAKGRNVGLPECRRGSSAGVHPESRMPANTWHRVKWTVTHREGNPEKNNNTRLHIAGHVSRTGLLSLCISQRSHCGENPIRYNKL